MVLRCQSGEEIRKGDRVLYHREPAQIEFVASDPNNSELEWFLQEYGGGVMVLEGVSGRTFIPTDQIGDCDDLEFVARDAAI